MQKEAPGDFFYYRPCTRGNEEVRVVNNPEEDDIQYMTYSVDQQQLANQMLFIHMSAAQRYILNRFVIAAGKVMCGRCFTFIVTVLLCNTPVFLF